MNKPTGRQRQPNELIEAGDFIEWTTGGFTTVDPGSCLIGKHVDALPMLTKDNGGQRPALVFGPRHATGPKTSRRST